MRIPVGTQSTVATQTASVMFHQATQTGHSRIRTTEHAPRRRRTSLKPEAKAINQGTSIYASEEAPSSNQSAWTTLVQGLDPAYLAINSYYNEWQATENGCGLSTEAKYGAEGVAGVGITALPRSGLARLRASSRVPTHGVDVGQRGFHIHYDTVPHGEIGSHLQIDTWLKGVSGSGTSLRVPWPPW